MYKIKITETRYRPDGAVLNQKIGYSKRRYKTRARAERAARDLEIRVIPEGATGPTMELDGEVVAI